MSARTGENGPAMTLDRVELLSRWIRHNRDDAHRGVPASGALQSVHLKGFRREIGPRDPRHAFRFSTALVLISGGHLESAFGAAPR